MARARLVRAAEEARTFGSEILRGPRNLSRVEEIGLLVQGRGRPPMLAGHSAAYYPALVEAEGFEPHHDVLAYDTPLYDAEGEPRSLPPDLDAKARAVDLPGLEVRPTRWTRITRDLTLAHEVFVEAFRDVPDNTPMPLGQWLAIGRSMLALSNRHMLQRARGDGWAAGFARCFPDVTEAGVAARGRLLPLGWLRAFRARKHIRTASFKLIGVLPEYRSSGLHALMIERAVFGARDAGYSRLEASLVDARNGRMRSVIEGAGMNVYRRYRIYERAV